MSQYSYNILDNNIDKKKVLFQLNLYTFGSPDHKNTKQELQTPFL